VNGGITAHIWAEGVATNISTGIVTFDDVQRRDFARSKLEACFSELWSVKTKVLFCDEIES